MRAFILALLVSISCTGYAEAVGVQQENSAIMDIAREEKARSVEDTNKGPSNKVILNKVRKAIIQDQNDDIISIDRSTHKKINLLASKTASDKPMQIIISDKEFSKENIENILDNAYNASMVGQSEAAVFLYKKVLKQEPKSESVLYSLGTLYQKLHQYQDAIRIYKRILMLNPSHKKAFNNFMVVIAKEHPEEALDELFELADINADYSPIQAQIGMIYAQQGKLKKALIYMKKAAMLSPEIINYRYNLAVLYDKLQMFAEARRLYAQVLEQRHRGAILPQSHEAIRERLMYLRSR